MKLPGLPPTNEVSASTPVSMKSSMAVAALCKAGEISTASCDLSSRRCQEQCRLQLLKPSKALVKQDKSREVPFHLRNSLKKLMKELGYGLEYRYAHVEPNADAAGETYLPDGIEEPGWYQPVPRGLDIKIGEKLAFLRKLDNDAGE